MVCWRQALNKLRYRKVEKEIVTEPGGDKVPLLFSSVMKIAVMKMSVMKTAELLA